MGDLIKAIATGTLGLVLLIGVSWGGYLLYLRIVEGPAITQHASNVRHSLNFTQGVNQRVEGLIPEYLQAKESQDVPHASALLNQICSTASTINPDEQDSTVRQFVSSNCGG